MAEPVKIVSSDNMKAGPGTPGMHRAEAFAAETVWVGEVRTDPGIISGWHHHGEHSTYGRVLDGAARFEFGPGGTTAVEAGAGEFFFVPPHTVHRESNPGETEQVLVVVRLGSGPTVVNVETPDAD